MSGGSGGIAAPPAGPHRGPGIAFGPAAAFGGLHPRPRGSEAGPPASVPRLASLSNQFNTTWGGYVLCVAQNATGACTPGNGSTRGFDVALGTWNISPVASTLPVVQTAFTFAGIGGFGESDLVRVGTEAVVGPTLAPGYSAFWQMAPGAPQRLALSPDPNLSAGDGVTAFLQLNATASNGSQTWWLKLSDATTGSSGSTTVLCYRPACYPSSFDSVEWVEAVPPANGSPLAPPAFQQFDVWAAYQVNGSTQWGDPINGITLDLLNPTYSSGDLVLTSGIEQIGYGGLGSQFYFCYLLDSIDLSLRGSRGVLTPTEAGPGNLLAGQLEMEAPDGFTAGGVASLALALEISGAGRTCTDGADALAQFAGVAGRANYSTDLRVCAGLPSGTYRAETELYFDPRGVLPGDPGSLLVATSGTVFPALSIIDFTAGPVAADPLSGSIDAGDRLNLSVNVSAIGPYAGPYVVQFTGAPPGCQGRGIVPGPAVGIWCFPSAGGTFRIGANVSVPNYPIWAIASGNVSYLVLPAPHVALAANATSLDLGMEVGLAANATGGDGTYHYAWTGLPTGCGGADFAALDCTPSAPGNYSIAVDVTDGTGLRVNSAPVPVAVAAFPAAVLAPTSPYVRAGGEVALVGNVSGGTPPYRWAWSGLPPGCPPANDPTIRCTLAAPGDFTVRVTATDALGQSTTASATLHVDPPVAFGSPYALSTAGWIVVGATAAALAAIGVVRILARRQR